VAFDCTEMDKVVAEIKKIEEWLTHCHCTLFPDGNNSDSLLSALLKIRGSMDNACMLYSDCNQKGLCAICSCDVGDHITPRCMICQARYHSSCVEPLPASTQVTREWTCPFCFHLESGDPLQNRLQEKISKGNRPALPALIGLRSFAKGFYSGIEELDLLEEIAEKAHKFKSYLMQILHDADSYHGEDLSVMHRSLLIALKATSAAGLYDHQISCRIESMLSRYSWKKRIHILLCGGKKIPIQQVLMLDNEVIQLVYNTKKGIVRPFNWVFNNEWSSRWLPPQPQHVRCFVIIVWYLSGLLRHGENNSSAETAAKTNCVCHLLWF
jgi:histone demethylase JARID1